MSLVYRQVLSSSSSPTSSTSLSQEAVTLTQHPASTGSESVSDEVRGDSSRGPAETENPNKNDDNEEVLSDPLRDLPEWLEELRHNLEDESVPEHRDASSSSHVMNYFQSREQKWYRVSTVFLLISRRTEIAMSA